MIVFNEMKDYGIALKGQKLSAQGNTLGNFVILWMFALKGQKLSSRTTPRNNAFALSGRASLNKFTQGVALGW